MNSPSKIGFLMPYSGIYPYYAQHFMTGFSCAASELGIRASEFAFVPAYIGQGGRKGVVEAVQKLVFFDGVDVIMGMLSLKSIEDIRPMLENHHKFGLFFDMGELVPPPNGFGPFINTISLAIWQTEYVLGKWAVNTFGSSGQMLMPLYESGFNLGTSFFNGAVAAGSAKLGSFVLPEAYANSETLNLEPFFEAIDKDMPDFVHAIFTGDLGNRFLTQWKNSKFYDTIPLITVENMAYPDKLEEVNHLGIKFYSAFSWSRRSEEKKNKGFVTKFEDFSKQDANIFAMMGYESGIAISTMLPLLKKRQLVEAANHLESRGVAGPRGHIMLQKPISGPFPIIDICKINTGQNAHNHTIIAQDTALGYDISTVFHETESGWQNPYLSV
jgi:branched-chain amino acid transport system substrate-binding protein